MKKLQNTQGFTIIETSLVLAIAGLILVMAFVALPALQRQTRDAKRKEDAATFMQALTKYQENNRGQLPKLDGSAVYDGFYQKDSVSNWSDPNSGAGSAWKAFYTNYLGDSLVNPEGSWYTFLVANSTFLSASYIDSFIQQVDFSVFVGAACENGVPVASSNNRNVAMMVRLDSKEDFYCLDN